MNPAIAIQIPVLARPHRVEPTIASIIQNTEVEAEIVFICSPGDSDELDAVRWSGEDYIVTDWEPGDGDFAKKHNLAFRHTSAPLILLAADDLEYEPGWDTKVIETWERTHAGVIGTNDDANPLVRRGKHATHPVVSRDYINRKGGTWADGPGIIYHEGYKHQYVDTELVAAAAQRGEWAFAHGAIVRHLHPLFPKKGQAKTPMDNTYRKALADAHTDNALYRMRQAEDVRLNRR